MRRFVLFCEKIQYVGLLGLLSLIFDNKLLGLLWLFWLFGFIPIFYNPAVFLQSLKQLGGMMIVLIRYGSRIPGAEHYNGSVKYSLPFHGTWTVVNGGVEKATSHSWGIQTQRYAYDFLILDEEGHSFSGNRTNPENYYCYGKEILAPADGEVVEVKDKYPDSVILGNGQVDCAAKDIRGNYILIRHADKEYGLLAHLKPGSIRVKPGDIVKRGQHIADCGNSGYTSEPHLHFHVQDGRSFFISVGLPIQFTDITAHSAPGYASYDSRTIPPVSALNKRFIMRGQNVANI
ncbi:MAG TPA: M23 family metallopeptidase [Clostridiaceae bacterium]|nr:M23 family metallopeptidase [Clostridiaceae bacterium]